MATGTDVARVFRGQFLVAIASALIWWLAVSPEAALAAFVGGMIALVPGLYFAARFFSRRAARSPRHMLRAFYAGETVKFGLTVVLFAIAIRYLGDHFMPLIVTFALAIFVYWVVLARTAHHTSGKEQ